MKSCILKLLTILAFFLASSTALDTYAQKTKPTEYEVKAAFIYNFAKFVEWPADTSDDNMTLCILGQDPFGSALDNINGKTVCGKTLMVKHINSVQNLDNADMLFISSSEKEHLGQLIEVVGDLSILTIADTEGYAEQGVIINFYLERKKVRFEINVEAAERSGLKLSSKLLNLAKIVPGTPER